jgi:lactoylglutathione lyase
MPTFGYTIFYVADVEQTVAFYEKAFDFSRKFVTEDNTYGELDTGATTLSFANLDFAGSLFIHEFTVSQLKNPPFGLEIGIVTDDVDQTVAQAIEAGAVLLVEPQTKPWGQVVAYLRDPNGFLVEVCTAME